MSTTVHYHSVIDARIVRRFISTCNAHTLELISRDSSDHTLTVILFGDINPIPLHFGQLEDAALAEIRAEELERYREIRQHIVEFRERCALAEQMDTGEADRLLRAIAEVAP
jgi:hypothetical protein